jgi:DNA primase large subunit
MLDSNSTAWIKGYYIYVSDEKLVLLLQMLIGNNIQRIDKLVSTADNR